MRVSWGVSAAVAPQSPRRLHFFSHRMFYICTSALICDNQRDLYPSFRQARDIYLLRCRRRDRRRRPDRSAMTRSEWSARSRSAQRAKPWCLSGAGTRRRSGHGRGRLIAWRSMQFHPHAEQLSGWSPRTVRSPLRARSSGYTQRQSKRWHLCWIRRWHQYHQCVWTTLYQ